MTSSNADRREPPYRCPTAILLRCLPVAVSVMALTGCAATIRTLPPDWTNPGHRLVGEQLLPLLQAAGRDPHACGVVFFDTPHVNAAALGNCTFGFTTGLAESGDRRLIAGVAAHEVAHDALAHPEKADLAAATVDIASEVADSVAGSWGALASLGIILASMVVLPTYSRSLEAAADEKALELLRAHGDPDPPGTMAHTFEVLLAREGATGGSILSTHPGVGARLEGMRALQAHELEGHEPNEQESPASRDEPVNLNVFRKAEVAEPSPPRDPRSDWPERYRKVAAEALPPPESERAL